MRLRNIRRADGTIKDHEAAINEPERYRGKWTSIFGNEHPIHIEIGMGKGQFLLSMAARHPDINYVGIERYASVLLRALEKFDSGDCQSPPNIKFLCMDARRLGDVFAPGEVKKIYLNFSDPWPKARHAKRRLPSKEFLACYTKVLDINGVVEFKTDNRPLFEFALEQVKEAGWVLQAHTFDLHHDTEMSAGNVMTEYEDKFSSMGNPIHKLVIKQKQDETSGIC